MSKSYYISNRPSPNEDDIDLVVDVREGDDLGAQTLHDAVALWCRDHQEEADYCLSQANTAEDLSSIAPARLREQAAHCLASIVAAKRLEHELGFAAGVEAAARSLDEARRRHTRRALEKSRGGFAIDRVAFEKAATCAAQARNIRSLKP